jgi:hypothetical protein
LEDLQRDVEMDLLKIEWGYSLKFLANYSTFINRSLPSNANSHSVSQEILRFLRNPRDNCRIRTNSPLGFNLGKMNQYKLPNGLFVFWT